MSSADQQTAKGRARLRWLDRIGIAIGRLGEASALLLLTGPILLVIWLSFGADRYTTIPPSSYDLTWYANILKRPEFVARYLTESSLDAVANTPGEFAEAIRADVASFGEMVKVADVQPE